MNRIALMIAMLFSTTALSADDQAKFEQEIAAARRALLGLPDMRAVLLAELEQKIADGHEKQLAKQKREILSECKKQCTRYLLILKSHGRRIDRLYRQWAGQQQRNRAVRNESRRRVLFQHYRGHYW